jgi:hypothetical protein
MDEDDKSPLSGLQKELEGIGDRFGKALYTNINPTQIKKIFDEVETSACNVLPKLLVWVEPTYPQY